jgi:hypothetical protein
MVHYDMRSSVLLRKPYGSIPKYNLLNNLFEYSYAFGFVLSAKIHFHNTVIVPTWCHVNRGRACIAQAIAHEDALVKKSCTDYEKCLVCSSTVRRYRRGLNQLAYEMRASGGFQNGRTEPPLIAACGAGR